MGHFDVVAIGASAGGIRALAEVLSSLPADLPVAILIVQHLDPGHASLIAGILQRRCRLKVTMAEHGDIVAPSVAYIAPPDRHMMLVAGKIALMSTEPVHHSRPSIDVLFDSVAASQDGKAIGVILTGSSIDGTAGIKAIKQAGGTTIAQDPNTAEHSIMPASAIATGMADYVLPLSEIAPAITRLVTGK